MVPSLEETDDEAAHRQHEEILSILDPEVVFFATPSSTRRYLRRPRRLLQDGRAVPRDLWDIADGVEMEYIDGGGDLVITLASWTAVCATRAARCPCAWSRS